jgi:hypothetical protein
MNSASRGLRPTVGLRRPEKRSLRRRRPTPGARAPWKADFQFGAKAYGRGLACAPNEFGLQGPSAGGRPAPTGRVSFASAEADPRRAAPWKADFNRHEGLRPTVGLRRLEKRSLRRRRPTPGAERPGRPISIGAKAYGRGLACAPNEFGLQGPSAGGRPAPTGKALFASAEADAWRESASEGRFQSA